MTVATETVTCDSCSRTARRRPTKGGKPYRCRECRKAAPAPYRNDSVHGTAHGYDRLGCRCRKCRRYKAGRNRDYTSRFREEHGVLPSTVWKREHGVAAYHEARWIDPDARLAIYERDDWTCHLCNEPTDPTAHFNGDRFPSLDHLVPRSLGGDHDPLNLKTAHRLCNSNRGADPLT